MLLEGQSLSSLQLCAVEAVFQADFRDRTGFLFPHSQDGDYCHYGRLSILGSRLLSPKLIHRGRFQSSRVEPRRPGATKYPNSTHSCTRVVIPTKVGPHHQLQCNEAGVLPKGSGHTEGWKAQQLFLRDWLCLKLRVEDAMSEGIFQNHGGHGGA